MSRFKPFEESAINFKRYERNALLKFFAIYMVTSFALLAIVAALYYKDAQKDAVIALRSEMLGYLSELRKGNTPPSKHLSVLIDEKAKYFSPSFGLAGTHYQLVACSNDPYEEKVFVITAPHERVEAYSNEVVKKIALAYALLFIPFALIGWLLSKLALRSVRESFMALQAFNADIVHDLKTPITTIGINAEEIAHNPKSLARIMVAVSTLEALYRNLESYLIGEEHFKMQIFRLDTFIKERIELFRTLCARAEFVIDVAPIVLRSDREALSRIIDNLLSNALKHSAHDPKITLRSEATRLIISDNGKGIEDIEKIFKRYYRENFYVKGFGLGMNIVRRLCEVLGIGLHVYSKKGEGSSFVLELKGLSRDAS